MNILPYVPAISHIELGAFLVTNGASGRFNEVARQQMSDEIMRQLTQGDWGYRLLGRQRLWLKSQSRPANLQQRLLARHQLRLLFGLLLCVAGQVLGAIVIGSRAANEQALRQYHHWLAALAQLVALYLDNLRLRTKNICLTLRPRLRRRQQLFRRPAPTTWSRTKWYCMQK